MGSIPAVLEEVLGFLEALRERLASMEGTEELIKESQEMTELVTQLLVEYERNAWMEPLRVLETLSAVVDFIATLCDLLKK